MGQSGSGLISIACIPTAAFYFLPEVIRRFGLRHPKIRFRVMDLPANQCIDAVAAGEVEFGISLISTSNTDLDFVPLAEDPFVLAARREHRLMRRKSVRWEELAGEQIISVHRSSANRLLLDAALGRVNVRLDWKYEVTHLSTSLGLVEAGLGIAVLPRMATPIDEHPILMTRPVVDPTITRTIGIVRRRNASLSPAAERFHELLLNEWGKAFQGNAS
ncbi:LysR substrate-binding domain-containing protein [Solirhodobacter olei]|uniref:LysR substrate-binding domain-containing protein n=1 Tax=Solirhodobacter olei TaxID=2493082 RepID=UPI000FDC6879|nr:LysR substrate-binding domain-containing protein [Solirhodobacter olei]